MKKSILQLGTYGYAATVIYLKGWIPILLDVYTSQQCVLLPPVRSSISLFTR